MYVNNRDEINYHGFLLAQRLLQDATLSDVATGLCSESEIHRVEVGKRQPEKLMRDRIAARLGVSGEEYEDYLHKDEYRQWQLRQYVLKALDRKDFVEAERGIEDLDNCPKKNCVQEQFVETMRYIIRQMQGATVEELRPMIEHTISFTIPDVEKALDGAHLLAEQELNLIIEYKELEKCPQGQDEVAWRLGQYERIIFCLDKSYIDAIGKAKVYPRIACNVSKIVLETEASEEQLSRAREICEKAIEFLRSTSRLFYFVEVVEYHSALVSKLKPYGYKKILKRNEEWVELFKELYTEYDVSIYMQNFCYFYWESECHSIVEVLEVRRGMMGLSRAKLGGNICAEKTIIRYERYGYSPILPVVRDLFESMGLCAEYKRARVITSSSETLYLANEVAEDVNNYNAEDGLEKIDELKMRLNMSIPFNRQEILMMETLLRRVNSEIEEEELRSKLFEALVTTISFENITRKNMRYLTRSELTCMYDIAFLTKENESEICLDIIYKLCKNILKRDMRVGRVPVYELLIGGLGDYLGDIGKNDEAMELNNKLLKECLKYKRMFSLARATYDNMWNSKILTEQDGSCFDIRFEKTVLRNCIVLSKLNYRTNLEAFFQQKINSLRISV